MDAPRASPRTKCKPLWRLVEGWPDMGRYKLGPQGGYYDPNDSGPDQFTPTPGQQYPGMPAPQQAPQGQPQQPGGIDPNAPPGTYKPWMESGMGNSGVPTTPGVNGQPVYTGGYDPNSPLYQKGGGAFGGGQIGQGGGKQAPPGYHYGMDWTSNQLFPDNPNDPNTPPMQKHGEGWMGVNDAPMGGGQSPWMTLGSLGQGGGFGGQNNPGSSTFLTPYGATIPRETGPPPGMSQEAWQQGEDYLNRARNGGGSIYGSLGSLGGALGANGGNVQPKTGMLGPIVNQFKR